MEKEEYFEIPPVEQLLNYNTKGLETSNLKETIVAKIIKSNTGGITYRVACFAGNLYDPGGSYSNREAIIRTSFKYKNVSKELFDKYLQFLKTRKNDLFNSINRRVMDG